LMTLQSAAICWDVRKIVEILIKLYIDR